MAWIKFSIVTILSALIIGGSIIFSGAILGEANFREQPNENYALSLRANKDLLFEVPTAEKVIALTFDDGPDESTEQILDVLKQYGVKATFFVVGDNCRRYPDILKRIAKEGHEIENHTYSHLKFKGKSQQVINQEIVKTNEIIYEITGNQTRFFRPPGGTINDKILQVAKMQNLQIVLWTPEEDSKDWQNPGVATIIKKVVSHAKQGSIVLLHDGGGKRKQTLLALPIIIKRLKAEGYQLVTIDELLKAQSILTSK